MNEKDRQYKREEIKRFLLSRDEVTFAYLHGSFFEGAPFHDIDIGVFVHDIPKDIAAKYGLELSGILENIINIPIDIRVINFAPIPFLFYVVRSELIMSRDEEVEASFTERVIKSYLDMKPLRDRAFKEMFS